MLDIGFHLITGMMVGAEYLHIIEDDTRGIVIDLFIIRITILWQPANESAS